MRAISILGALLLLALAWASIMTARTVELEEELRRAHETSASLAARLDAGPPEASEPRSAPAPEPEPLVSPPEPVVEEEVLEEPRWLAYSFEEFRERLLSGDPDLQELITPRHIEETLDALGRTPDLLVAAALLSDDPDVSLAYLEEALELDPSSPGALAAVIGARASRNELDPDEIARLKEVDPGNALADYYEALAHFQSDDAEAALESIRNAVGKTRLSNYGLGNLSALETFYDEAGCSEGVSRTLAAFRLPLEYVGPFRDLNTRVMEQIEQTAARGDYEIALGLARDASHLGGTMASSGRYLLSDLLGMSFRGQILEKEIEIHRALGQYPEIDHLQAQLQRNEERRERLRRVAAMLPEIAGEFSEDELLEYLQRVVTLGEDGALIGLPELRDRLAEED